MPWAQRCLRILISFEEKFRFSQLVFYYILNEFKSIEYYIEIIDERRELYMEEKKERKR